MSCILSNEQIKFCFFLFFDIFLMNAFFSMLTIQLSHSCTLLCQVKYQPRKVKGISYLPHDCLSNCSTFCFYKACWGSWFRENGGVSDKKGFPHLILIFFSVCPSCLYDSNSRFSSALGHLVSPWCSMMFTVFQPRSTT